MRKLYLLFLFFLSVASFSLKSQAADEDSSVVPYLIINFSQQDHYLIKLGEDFKINNLGEEIEIKGTEESKYISLSDMSSFGFLYQIDQDASLDSIDNDLPKNWQVYDSKGILINEIYSIFPDLSNLKKGEIYIIRSDNHTYKYIPAK